MSFLTCSFAAIYMCLPGGVEVPRRTEYRVAHAPGNSPSTAVRASVAGAAARVGLV